ncbi:MAG: hypothetical protein LBT16_08790 [Treponema sp.]|jgi:hypothetical protein|nr:hypothetical protein [Treponema sp.]
MVETQPEPGKENPATPEEPPDMNFTEPGATEYSSILRNSSQSGFALNEYEERLVREIEVYLDGVCPEESSLIRSRFSALKQLGAAITQFPPVRNHERLREELRDWNTLMGSLDSFNSKTRLLHLPTRIVASKTFFVAKCHAFSLTAKLVRDHGSFYDEIRQVIFSVVCSIMAVEVYFSCLEDPIFPQEIKKTLLEDLISLWDSGVELNSAKHRPALEALWTARDSAPPSFGTMDGGSELVRISLSLGKDWHEFLVTKLEEEEPLAALEEFLFGLSYEEIKEVRSRLTRFGIHAIGHDEVRSFLGTRPAYTMVKAGDPREIYDFYIERREMALYRKQGAIPGPKQTLEEMYLRFRLAQACSLVEQT